MQASIANQMNELGSQQLPFLFLLDFELEKPLVLPLSEAPASVLTYLVNDGFMTIQNASQTPSSQLITFGYGALPFATYQKAFDIVKAGLNYGNSFLANLTAETPLKTNASLEAIFQQSHAPYIVYKPNDFLCYSPETFVQITATGEIRSYPIKGSLDATLPNAAAKLLADKKELYEHTTIVDLIRNDISQVASKVWVERFRYLQTIQKANGQALLQMCSDIRGQLPQNWHSEIGTILLKLLPAGSVSGAPKAATVSMLQAAEKFTYGTSNRRVSKRRASNRRASKRGYYTGIFGIFDGEKLTSSVLIRFIEQQPTGLVFKSGGGITTRSNAQSEYEELLQKIYIPVAGNSMANHLAVGTPTSSDHAPATSILV